MMKFVNIFQFLYQKHAKISPILWMIATLNIYMLEQCHMNNCNFNTICILLCI